MLWLFVCLTTASAFGAGMALAQVRGRRQDAQQPAQLPPPSFPPPAGDALDDLFRLKTGDVVCHMGQDHVAARVDRLESRHGLLVRAQLDGDPTRSMVMVDVPRPVAMLCQRVDNGFAVKEPLDTVEHGGMRYRRLRRLDLKDAARGGTASQVHLHEAADGCFLLFLQTMGGWEMLEGRSLRLADVMVLHV